MNLEIQETCSKVKSTTHSKKTLKDNLENNLTTENCREFRKTQQKKVCYYIRKNKETQQKEAGGIETKTNQ